MALLVKDELELFYVEHGQGDPLILVHGLGSDHTAWEVVHPFLSDKYSIIVPDLRGHGSSSINMRPYSIDLFADDIISLMDELKITRAHLVGQSMGGAIIQKIALKYPERVRSLTIIASFSYADDHLKKIFNELREDTVNGGYGAFFDHALQLVYTQGFLESNQDFLNEIKLDLIKIWSVDALLSTIDACVLFNVKDELKRIKSPSMIIYGEEDVFTPPYHSQFINEEINHSDIKSIPKAAHNLIVETPQETATLIIEFLDRV